jgi:hypothetical protein
MALPSVELLEQMDLALSKCGRPVMPAGVRYVPVPMDFFFQSAHAANTTETEAREIFGDTVWMLRAISGLAPNNQIYFRIQFPNGRYYQNQLRTLGAAGGGAQACTLGNGSARTLISPSVPCPPGSRILITLDDRPTNGGIGAPSTTAVAMLLEGAYIYAIKGQGENARSAAVEMAEMQRYFLTPNQNIMAPEVALSLHSAQTPAGYIDEPFQYQLPQTSFELNTVTSATQAYTLPAQFEHHILRLMFNETGTGPGQIAVRVRESGGYAFDSDYIETFYFSGGRYACDWSIKRGSQLYFDFSLLDGFAGQVVTEQVIIEGIRRRPQ